MKTRAQIVKEIKKAVNEVSREVEGTEEENSFREIKKLSRGWIFNAPEQSDRELENILTDVSRIATKYNVSNVTPQKVSYRGDL